MCKNYKLIKGDCLEIMKDIKDDSIDMILCDLPYGTTRCKWDTIIPFESLWIILKRIRKDNAPIILFGSEPFSSKLRISNLKEYKYDWYWRKTKANGFFNVKKMPLKDIETLSVFYKNLPKYYPQGIQKYNKEIINNRGKINNKNHISGHNGGAVKTKTYIQEFKNYPRQVLDFSIVSRPKHPTQKPTKLLEYLIKTYTDENDTVLDCTMGSGSTGEACLNTNRKFIGIEKDDKYFEIAEKRINDTYKELNSIA